MNERKGERPEMTRNMVLWGMASIWWLCAAATCGHVQPARASGIEGTVMRGPVCPGPVRSDRPCPDKPVSATFQVLDRENRVVATFHSNEDGSFHADLSPGEYTVLPEGEKPARNPLGDSARVKVQEGQITQVHLFWDTGMR